MFFKYVALLSFAVTAIAGAIAPGRYRIFTVNFDSTARVRFADGPVFVDSANVNAGAFEVVSPSLGHLSLNFL
jgi:hypothetical protein